MAEITKITQDLAVIQKLDDYPNDVGGLTAAQFKAKFDEAGLSLQTYINDVLIPALIAANIPFTPTAGVNETNVQAAIANVQAQIVAAVAGTIPDGSVTLAKLAQEVKDALSELQTSDTTLGNAVTALNTNKADKAQTADVTLTVAGWTGTAAPYSWVATVAGVTADSILLTGLATSASTDAEKQYSSCGVKATSQGSGTVTFTAGKAKPTANIPVTVIRLG